MIALTRSMTPSHDPPDIHNYMRGILEYYGLIIPIKLNQMANQPNVAGGNGGGIGSGNGMPPSSPSRARSGSSSSFGSIGDDNAICRYYLMPSLLNDHNGISSSLRETTSNPAQTSFERCFRFENYIPLGLLHKLLAKVYASPKLVDYVIKESVSKNYFLLRFKYFRVFVRLYQETKELTTQDYEPSSPTASSSSSSPSSSSSSESQSTVINYHVLAISSCGFMFNSNDMLEKMDDLCNFVRNIIDDIPGLLPLVEQITFCPR